MDLLERLKHQNQNRCRKSSLFDAFNRANHGTPVEFPDLPDDLSWSYRYMDLNDENRKDIQGSVAIISNEYNEFNLALVCNDFQFPNYHWSASVYVDIEDGTGTTVTVNLSDETELVEVDVLKSIKIRVDPDDPRTSAINVNTLTVKFEDVSDEIIGVLDVIKILHADEFAADLHGADVEYIVNHAGHKEVSNMTGAQLLRNGEDMEDGHRALLLSGIEVLADHIWTRFGRSWQRIYETLMDEYKALNNYDMVEEETPNISRKHQVSDDYEHNVHKKSSTNLTTEDEGSDVEGSRYGFNSTDPVPTDKTHTEGSVTVSGLDTDNYDDTTETQAGYTEDTETGTRGLTRSGNIGVMSSQALALEELNLRASKQLLPILFQSLDEVLTVGNYVPVVSTEIYFNIGG